MVEKLTVEQIIALLAPYKKKVLDVAQAALPPQQFEAVRRLTLDALGDQGFEGELKRQSRKN